MVAEVSSDGYPMAGVLCPLSLCCAGCEVLFAQIVFLIVCFYCVFFVLSFFF